MSLPPTWSVAVADVVRYASLRPWQPRLTLQGAREPLPQRIERLHAVWTSSRLSDGKRAADFNVDILSAAVPYSQA